MYLLLISVHQGDDGEYDEDCLAADNLDCLRHGVLRKSTKPHSPSLECKSARVDGDGYGHKHSRAPLRQVKLVNKSPEQGF